MTRAAPPDLSTLDHALILAPYRKDADYLGRLLSEHEIPVETCSRDGDITGSLSASPGVLMATIEALTPSVLDAVALHLELQPSWSELPVVVLVDRNTPNDRVRDKLSRAWPRARQLFYQRPVGSVELVSGVQSALLARLRQRDVRDHLAREIELRRELNHRVKNILASVTSIFEMTKRGAVSIDSLAQDFGGRIGALAKVHSTVFQAAEDSVLIGEIVDLTFEPYRLAGCTRMVSSGPPLLLSREAATTLALCLHELATNAIKYGALSTPDGCVHFTWMVEVGTQSLLMNWQERGGPIVNEPVRIGYGTRYVRAALTSMLGRKPILTFSPDGLRCEASGPLSRIAPATPPDLRRLQ